MDGKTLKSLRRKAGLTQRDLAKRVNRSQANISQSESGDIGVHEDVARVAKTLKPNKDRAAKLDEKGGAQPRKKKRVVATRKAKPKTKARKK